MIAHLKALLKAYENLYELDNWKNFHFYLYGLKGIHGILMVMFLAIYFFSQLSVGRIKITKILHEKNIISF